MTTMKKVLEQARVALHNATSDLEVLTALTAYGYDSYRLQEGMALYEAARDSVQQRNDAYFGKSSATQTFQQRWKDAQLHYHHDLRAARVALKHVESWRIFLQLDGERSAVYEEWVDQARAFYYGLLNQPELQNAVLLLGLTQERINQGVRLLEALEAARLQQHAQRGSYSMVADQRTEAFDALVHWMVKFRQIARAIFADQPMHLATLGLLPMPNRAKQGDGVPVVPPVTNKPAASQAVAAGD